MLVVVVFSRMVHSAPDEAPAHHHHQPPANEAQNRTNKQGDKEGKLIPLPVVEKMWREKVNSELPNLPPSWKKIARDVEVQFARSLQNKGVKNVDEVDADKFMVMLQVDIKKAQALMELKRSGLPKPEMEAERVKIKNESDKEMTEIMARLKSNILMDAYHDAYDKVTKRGPFAGQIPSSPGSGHIGDMVKANPSSPAPLVWQAKDRLALGDIRGALQSADQAVKLGGGNEALGIRGDIRYQLGDMESANADAKKILETDPNSQQGLSLYYATKDRFSTNVDTSGESVSGSAAGAPENANSVSQLISNDSHHASQDQFPIEQSEREARNSFNMNDFTGAMNAVERILKQDPHNSFALNTRAAIYLKQKNYSAALADATAGLAQSPNDWTIIKNKSFAELKSGRYTDALASANSFIEHNPRDSYGYALRAQSYAHLGDREAYIADIKRAAKMDRYYQAAAERAHLVQLPADQDVLFLFPGEEPAKSVAIPQAKDSRNSQFRTIVIVSVIFGLILAFGLMPSLIPPLKEKVASTLTRFSRGPQPSPEPDPEVRLSRGQFAITRQIGEGGMGRVFEGIDRALGRRVAIKKIREELRNDGRVRDRFLTEARTVAALHHPNIVDIYAIVEDGPDVLIVFEFVTGTTVYDLLRGKGRLDPSTVLKIVSATAEALTFAHEHNVIHRDVKPSNIMVDGEGRIKVMDFGTARLAKDAMVRNAMTNTILGTPPYMAPEQEQGHIRRQSDVYSLAVCAYEMLCGHLPFSGRGTEMLTNKTQLKFIRPSQAVKEFSVALDGIFEQGFDPDPVRRFQSPEAFVVALRSALHVT
jgi:tetratricopeptide (TPR) repeat protein/tRNA A-37 threonylcarbamoyl transferase component Bud32